MQPYIKKPEKGALTVDSSDKGVVESPYAALKSVGLTSREIQILRQLALGKGDKEISIDLLISVKTVNHHVSNIILKLDAKNRTHAVAKALLARLIEMRASDAPTKKFDRRLGDRDKTALLIGNNMPVSLGRQMSGRVEEALPVAYYEDHIKSEPAI